MGPVPEQRTRRDYAGTVSYSEYHPFAARPFKSDWGPANAAIVSFDPANVKVSFFQTAAPTAQHSRGVFRQIRQKTGQPAYCRPSRWASLWFSCRLVPLKQALGKTH